jgi:hypothetical protein
MSEKVIKFIRWFIVIFFLSSIVLDSMWQGGKYLWAYWVSRILSGSEISIVGLAFIVCPKIMIRVCLINKEDLKEGIPRWKFIVFGLVAGISISVVGINFLAGIVSRWFEACTTILNLFTCIPPVP